MKKNYIEVSIIAGNETRKVAFAKGINREINFAYVKTILAEMRMKGYRKAEMVQVIRAEEAIVNGKALVDINGNEISKEDAIGYYLIIDGQHRTYAAALLNEELQEKGEPTFEVPGILVELKDGETVAEYISSINITKNPWKIEDYIRGAANVVQNELLIRYKELIKSKDNPNGFPLSTLNLIFCNNSKAIDREGLSLLCQGEKVKGKAQKDIIPPHSIERGNRFINLCEEKGFTTKDISKRYLAERFSSYFNESGGEEKAFAIFNMITDDDRKAMYNKNGSLIESNVIERFKLIKSRME